MLRASPRWNFCVRDPNWRIRELLLALPSRDPEHMPKSILSNACVSCCSWFATEARCPFIHCPGGDYDVPQITDLLRPPSASNSKLLASAGSSGLGTGLSENAGAIWPDQRVIRWRLKG
jgi:hypothetical protein